MTLIDAIRQTDEHRHNNCSQAEKLRWLSRLDGMIATELMDTHEGGKPFAGYDASTPLDTALLVPEPFEELYLYYLLAQIDFRNGEYDRYNQSMNMFLAAYKAYAAWYNRSRTPLGQRFRYF